MKALGGRRFLEIWILISLLLFVMQSSYFYEDSVYLSYAVSLVHDFDFNLINQLEPQLTKIVTRQYSPPTHHSVIQTPLIIVANSISYILNVFISPKSLPPFVFSGVFVSLLCLLTGYKFLEGAAKNLQVRIKKIHFILFFATSSLTYFSFFVLTVMEVFTFMLSTYVLCTLTHSLSREINKKELVALGASSAMLLIAKVTFLPLFILSIYLVFRKNNQTSDKLIYVSFILIVFATALLKDYSTFGEIVLISKTMSQYTTNYSFYNLLQTIKLGFFGEGGLFYSNPIYLIGLGGFVHYLNSSRRESVDKWVILLSLMLWLAMSLLQTVFIVGPMLEDHFVGRLALMGLPVMILGIAHLDSVIQFRYHKVFKCTVLGSCCLLHVYAFLNFMYLYSKGHYEYAVTKTASSFEGLVDYIFGYSQKLVDHFVVDSIYLLSFSLILTILFIVVFNSRHRVFKAFIYSIPLYSVILFGFCVCDFMYSKKNGEAYIGKENKINSITFADHPSMYSFNYIVDILISQRLNSKDPRLKEMVIRTHKSYLKSLTSYATDATFDFKEAIASQNINYTCF